MSNGKPFVFNFAALQIVPILATKATTAAAQIDAIYDVADDPSTPKAHAIALSKLAGKMIKRLDANVRI